MVTDDVRLGGAIYYVANAIEALAHAWESYLMTSSPFERVKRHA